MVVGEKPSANVCIGCRWIEQFNAIDVRRRACRKDFIDHNVGNGRCGVICPGRTTPIRTGAPTCAIIGSLGEARIFWHERKAEAVCGHRPWRLIVVGDGENNRAQRMREGELLAAIVELAGVKTVDDRSRIV